MKVNFNLNAMNYEEIDSLMDTHYTSREKIRKRKTLVEQSNASKGNKFARQKADWKKVRPVQEVLS